MSISISIPILYVNLNRCTDNFQFTNPICPKCWIMSCVRCKTLFWQKHCHSKKIKQHKTHNMPSEHTKYQNASSHHIRNVSSEKYSILFPPEPGTETYHLISSAGEDVRREPFHMCRPPGIADQTCWQRPQVHATKGTWHTDTWDGGSNSIEILALFPDGSQMLSTVPSI